MKIRTAALGGAAAGLLLLAGCSVDSAEVEDEIKSQLEAQLGIEDADVSCDEDIAAEEGETFNCSVTVDGETLEFEGVITSVDGGTVNFEVEPVG